MTQDHYDQAQDAGYGVRGDVIEDENDENPAGQSKPKTTFQKVASALRGDRPDRDEEYEDQAAEDQMGAAPLGAEPVAAAPASTAPVVTPAPTTADSDIAASSDTAADADVMPQGNPPLPASPDAADSTIRPAGATDAAADPDGTFAPADSDGVGAAAGADARQGDYWDESGAPVVGEVEVVTVTTADVPVTDSDADPLAGEDETVSQTRPDVTDAGFTDAGPTDASLGDVDGGNVDGEDAYAGDTPQAGAATVSDVPVTQVPEDAAATEASNGAGRDAGVPAQELRPGEAPNTLDDLGDLAYGKLLPEAVDFTEQWQQIQFRFVDDPQASVTEAAEVVEQVTAKLEAAIAERKRAIEERQRAIQDRQRSLRGRWGEGAETDTETLRETLRMYRAFLDQLIGPKA
jgi:hypothetical protein